MLEEGMKAFDFSLLSREGKMVNLSDFKGKKVIVYFYPKDNTPGCTRQACGFRDNYSQFEKRGIVVIGISKDSVQSHGKFAEKFQLPFIMLSDPEKIAINGYGVIEDKKLYGKLYKGVSRTTFIIDENGIIEKVMKKVKPDTNAAEILKYFDEKQ